MRYYSIEHPIEPGNFPQLEGNQVIEIHNFPKKVWCEYIRKEAWGCIEYERELPRHVAKAYHFVTGKRKRYLVKVTTETFMGVDAEDEEEAIEVACDEASSYDPNNVYGEIWRAKKGGIGHENELL